MRRRFLREASSTLLYGPAPTRWSRAGDLPPSKHSGGCGTEGSERESVQSYLVQNSEGFVRSRPDPKAAECPQIVRTWGYTCNKRLLDTRDCAYSKMES